MKAYEYKGISFKLVGSNSGDKTDKAYWLVVADDFPRTKGAYSVREAMENFKKAVDESLRDIQ